MIKMKWAYLFIFISTIVKTSESARILAVFPTPSISHQVVFRPLTQELVKRGHEVVVITADPAFPKGQAPTNLTEIDTHDVTYSYIGKFHATATGKNDDIVNQIKSIFHLFYKVFEEQIKLNEVQEIIQDKSQHFDLLLIEACVRPAIALSHIYKVPVIQVSSFGLLETNNEVFGIPMHPLLYPTCFRQRLHNLTYLEKIKELFNYYTLENIIKSYEETEDEMLKKIFGSDIPPIKELNNNVDMLFLNTHAIWGGNRPIPPSVVLLGGLHQKLEKELPKDIQSYLDSTKNGVIYVSFGTNVNPSALPIEKLKIFVKVFAKLPFDVLWKFDKDELPGLSKNVKLFKWLPQSDLLRHPKIKLFITQGGLQSTDEAITAGVPLIGMPMLGDQWFNVEKYVLYKIGLRVDMESFNEELLTNAINTITEDDSYRQNIVKLRTQIYDQPQKPLERAMWWIEHVLRHGGARHLRAPAANMSWREYLELDLIVIVLSIILAICLILITTVYYILKVIKNNFMQIKIKQT